MKIQLSNQVLKLLTFFGNWFDGSSNMRLEVENEEKCDLNFNM